MKENGRKKKGRDEESSFTVSDAIVERLAAWGVRRIYGFPGDGINGVLGALRRNGDRIEFIQVAHEELAGMAACRTRSSRVSLASASPRADPALYIC